MHHDTGSSLVLMSSCVLVVMMMNYIVLLLLVQLLLVLQFSCEMKKSAFFFFLVWLESKFPKITDTFLTCFLLQWGYVVITTPNGVLDHEEAVQQNVGGQVLGYFY